MRSECVKFVAPVELGMAPLVVGFSSAANVAINLDGINCVQHGDAQLYPLPIACTQVKQAYSKCAFNVDSTME